MQKTTLCNRLLIAMLYPSCYLTGWADNSSGRFLAKMLLVMKLTIFFLVAGLLGAHARSVSQSVTFSGNKITLEKVFSAIEKQTGYVVFCNKDDLRSAKRVTLNVRNMPLADLLDLTLRDQPLIYEINSKTIVITEKKGISETAGLLFPSSPLILITGIVRGEDNELLIGAIVASQKSKATAITNSQGAFTISVPSNDTLLVSYIGYNQKKVAVADQKDFLIVLTKTDKSLNEVVVIGYGEVRKKDLTGSVGQVTMSDLQKAPVKSFDDALAGRVAGVQVTSIDGQPGSLPSIVIRGGNSLTQENSPLYVIDGFPIEANDNNAINPADIESIDILKDASATAIYGARGANGVIIITTKKGKTGAPVVTYNGFTGWYHDARRIGLMNPYEFVRLQLDIDNVGATQLYLTNQNKTLDDYKNVTGTDWYEKVLQTAGAQSHSLSVTGGTPQTKYALSGSYFSQDGVFVNTGFRRYQGRFSIDQIISKKVKIGLNTNYSDAKDYGSVATNYDQGQAGASLMTNIWGYRPILTNNAGIDAEEELLDPNISPGTQFRVNPLLQLENELREKIAGNLLTNAYIDYEIIPGLKLKITGGLSRISIQNNIFNNSKTRSGSTYFPFSLGVNGSETFTNITNLSNENTLTYTKRFKKSHSITILAGASQQTNKTSLYGASASKIPNEVLALSGIDEGLPRTVQSSISDWVLRSYLGRINYSYKSKYLFTGTFRADGSSKFAPGHRWGYFPSAALAYRISEENFIKRISSVNDAKIRVSYGATGNNRVSDFAYLSSINVLIANGYSFGNDAPSQGNIVGTLGNPELKWETTNQFNAGLDLALWNNKVTITGDYYYKRTNDLLLNAQLPNSSGYLRAFKNVGSISNSGIELSVNSTNICNGSFSWNTSFNIAFNRSKVLALTQNQVQLPSSITVYGATNNVVYVANIGQPVAQFYGLIYEGTYKYDDFDVLPGGAYSLKAEIPANGGVRNQIRPGDARYKDISGDKTITTADYTTIGNPNPDYIGGINNNFVYKSFDLGIFFQFSYGNKIFNANKVLFENGRSIETNTNQFASLANRWSAENPTSDIPAANRLGGNFYSTRSVEDGSYLRLKTISAGYNFNSRLLRSAKIKAVRIYGSAQNLITWTKYSGTSPDVSTRNSALTPGFDISPYPAVRVITVGLNVTL